MTDLISVIDEPMIKLYENASKAHPKNENLATQWFMSLARTLDFKGQQMVCQGVQRRQCCLKVYCQVRRSDNKTCLFETTIGGSSASQEFQAHQLYVLGYHEHHSAGIRETSWQRKAQNRPSPNTKALTGVCLFVSRVKTCLSTNLMSCTSLLSV